MYYRRNMDENLRRLERQWRETNLPADWKAYAAAARRAGLCPKCQELESLSEDKCDVCANRPCEDCDEPLNCGRCNDYICDACQTQCAQCELMFCDGCVEKCPHCKDYFCKVGGEGWDEAPGCLPPGDEGHSCTDFWEEDEEFEEW